MISNRGFAIPTNEAVYGLLVPNLKVPALRLSPFG